MKKTCFVIMGFGIKNNMNLDLTYNKIIKPCIIDNRLIPFPLYNEKKYNAYRCDEISGTTSIDYKFVTCLNGADIVIADISTMNANAIYELGARHALKPKSTILLCAKDKKSDFKFFDITYVPIIFYEHSGMSLTSKVISDTTKQLNALLDYAINSTDSLPDNPIQRALLEHNTHPSSYIRHDSLYSLYLKGKNELDNNDFEHAEETLNKLCDADDSEENILLWILAKYKKAEASKSCRELIDCINIVKRRIDISNSKSEYLYGRLAAISLRVFQISDDIEYYYTALNYYRIGAEYCKNNLYCPRNYCALLLRIHEVTDDINIIVEYYYTAKHYAKLFLNMSMEVQKNGEYDDRVYYYYNVNDLKAIVAGEYENFDKITNRLNNDPDISLRQRDTIAKGIKKLNDDLNKIQNTISNFF